MKVTCFGYSLISIHPCLALGRLNGEARKSSSAAHCRHCQASWLSVQPALQHPSLSCCLGTEIPSVLDLICGCVGKTNSRVAKSNGGVCLLSLEGPRLRSSTVHPSLTTDTIIHSVNERQGQARHKALLQKGIQHEVYLADSCLAVLFSAQLGKAYLLAGGEVSESAQ